MPLRLYELAIADGSSISPYVWRIKYALAHKGLAYESVPLGFTEIPAACGGRYKTVPILEDGSETVCDSWAIADYLDRAYPDRPALFSSLAERAMVRFFDKWLMTAVQPLLFHLYVSDIHGRVRPEDQAYFRQSREQRIGQTLEAFTAVRESWLPVVRKALKPMRLLLTETPFLGGEAPNYADYIALGAFIWAGSVATLPLLEADDTLLPWIERGLDAYGGIGRVNAMPGLVA